MKRVRMRSGSLVRSRSRTGHGGRRPLQTCFRMIACWDEKIAKAYGCRYAGQPAVQYVAFLRKMKRLAEHLELQEMPSGDSTKTGLKLLDEYNYARYTKR